MMSLDVPAEADMESLGGRFAAACDGGGVFYLHGPLGAGKTTFVRGLCRGLGHTGFVRSPTFTLVESYHTGTREVHHFDLYRLSHPEELEFIGVRDYFTPQALCLVEWPERGTGVLPVGDVTLTFSYAPEGRRVAAAAGTEAGRRILGRLLAIEDGSDGKSRPWHAN